MRHSKIQFISSLGYLDPEGDDRLYSALMLQPRIVAGVTFIGVLFQQPWVFLALSAALGWSALIPARSLFDAVYNHGVARLRHLAPLAPAPAPRRFAGGVAAIVTFATGIALLAGITTAAWALEALVAAAVTAVVYGRSCAGADVYNALSLRRGRPLGSARL
jgi:hypothetical protein